MSSVQNKLDMYLILEHSIFWEFWDSHTVIQILVDLKQYIYICISCFLPDIIYKLWATSMIGAKQSHEWDSVFTFHVVFHSHLFLKVTVTLDEWSLQVIGAIVYMKCFSQVVSRPLGPEFSIRTGVPSETSPWVKFFNTKTLVQEEEGSLSSWFFGIWKQLKDVERDFIVYICIVHFLTVHFLVVDDSSGENGSVGSTTLDI